MLIFCLLCYCAQGGGKDDSAQGVGSDVTKVGEAIEEAKKLFASRK